MRLRLLQDLTMETELEAVNGRRVRAIEVFAHALHFFREHALKVHFKAPVDMFIHCLYVCDSIRYGLYV